MEVHTSVKTNNNIFKQSIQVDSVVRNDDALDPANKVVKHLYTIFAISSITPH
jgi:hypothetical protein